MPETVTICTVATPDREPLLRRMLATVDVTCPVKIAAFGDGLPRYGWPAPGPVEVMPVAGAFCLGKGRNVAAAQAKTPVLAFLDADMLLPPTWLQWAAAQAAAGAIVCPLYDRLERWPQPAHEGIGWGNAVLLAEYWRGVDGYSERGHYGGEDTDFIKDVRVRFRQRQPPLYRERWGLLHQFHTKTSPWHGETNDSK